MQRFNIYKKSKKIHWTNSLIIFTAILFSYYSQGKIDFFELAKILKIKSKTEIEDFRNKLALLK